MQSLLLAAPTTTAGTPQLIVAAVIGIAAIVLLIVWLKLHPFLSLTVGAGLMAVVAGVPYLKAFNSFSSGLGSTVASVGVLIALGAAIGTLLVRSGGADEIVDTVLAKTPMQRLPWALALVAFIIGIPLFFEVGVVLLIPVVMLAARRAKVPLVLLGIPALAGLSALHGLIPPHPGPLIAIAALKANLGMTLGLGLLVALPTVAISGPLLARYMARWVPIEAPALLGEASHEEGQRRPRFGVALLVVLLPVILMLLATLAETVGFAKSAFGQALTFVGTPLVALLITTLLALVLLGTSLGINRSNVSGIVGSSFGPIAGILLIVGAGGGFKQTLVDTGVGNVIASGLAKSALSPLLAAWLVAVLIRIATGSATVATITASGIVAPLASGLPATHVALMVLAVGAGSVFLSHVNDAGFWMVKEYFGMTVGQTFKTWALMECVLSVVALAFIMLLSLVV
ncbi:GntP family permease [Cellulomonas sp. SG140]|uniref:GntP family permease n=1 Tax=Cellulomonas sp. SG140 TaxID=2976536 RepID=UPI0021E7BFA1|nr:GntP family permease [Cellulomonas sp. SG140]